MLHHDGIAAKDENLLITDGCQQSFDLISKAFCASGRFRDYGKPDVSGSGGDFMAARAVPERSDEHSRGPERPLGWIWRRWRLRWPDRVKLILLTPDFQNQPEHRCRLASRRKVLELAGAGYRSGGGRSHLRRGCMRARNASPR